MNQSVRLCQKMLNPHMHHIVNESLSLCLLTPQKFTGSLSTTVTGWRKWGQELRVNCEEVKGHSAGGLVKIPFSLLQGYYVMALGIG